MSTLMRDQHGNRYRIVRAVRTRRCEETSWGACKGSGRIDPGEEYVRHVAFPGDVVDRVSVLVECLACAHAAGRPGIPEPPPPRPGPGYEEISGAWHDVTCPEGPECRDRAMHVRAQPLVNSGVVGRFVETLWGRTR